MNDDPYDNSYKSDTWLDELTDRVQTMRGMHPCVVFDDDGVPVAVRWIDRGQTVTRRETV